MTIKIIIANGEEVLIKDNQRYDVTYEEMFGVHCRGFIGSLKQVGESTVSLRVYNEKNPYESKYVEVEFSRIISIEEDELPF